LFVTAAVPVEQPDTAHVPESHVMSSKEVADKTDKTPGQVNRDIRDMMDGLKKDDTVLYHQYNQGLTAILDNRKYVSEYLMSRPVVELLVTGYSVSLRARVLNRLHELEEVVASRAIAAPAQTAVSNHDELEMVELLLAKARKQDARLVQVESDVGELRAEIREQRSTPAQSVARFPRRADLDTFTHLLQVNGIGLDPVAFRRACVHVGLIESCERTVRPRAPGGRTQKSYWVFTARGMQFGCDWPLNSHETQLLFEKEKFMLLYKKLRCSYRSSAIQSL
jgi:phage regulator Rha-like protein